MRLKFGSQLFVQLDIFHRDLMIRYPGRFYAGEQGSKPTRLADCVTPLVVEADGVVVPLGYGFGRQYALGSLLKDRLRDLAARWQVAGYSQFRELCRRVYAAACQPSDLPFLNWYELIGAQSVLSSPTTRVVG